MSTLDDPQELSANTRNIFHDKENPSTMKLPPNIRNYILKLKKKKKQELLDTTQEVIIDYVIEKVDDKRKKAFNNFKISDGYLYDVNLIRVEEVTSLEYHKLSVADRKWLQTCEKDNILNIIRSKETNLREKALKGIFIGFDDDFEPQQVEPKNDFEKMIKLYLDNMRNSLSIMSEHELEVKFGTKGKKTLSRNNYNDVIKKLKSYGFELTNDESRHTLKIQGQYKTSSGYTKLSSTRVEINGMSNIQKYCETEDLSKMTKNMGENNLKIYDKSFLVHNEKRIYPVNTDDFNFRLTYNVESQLNSKKEFATMINWNENKKVYRYLNRCSFKHPEYPFVIDISIVKNSSKDQNTRHFKPVYFIKDSNVFNNNETYEIEIELDYAKIKDNNRLYNFPKVVELLRKVIKYVLSGLQGTNYPISYVEQGEVVESYMTLVHGETKSEKNEKNKTRIGKNQFIGPNSVTLQLSNIVQVGKEETLNDINICNNFVVTEKADGLRHLLFVNDQGKIYLLSQSLDVKFTGTITKNRYLYNSLIDGELITHDKTGQYINAFMAFDIYYINNKDKRSLPFMDNYDNDNDNDNKKNKKYETRFQLLIEVINDLNPECIVKGTRPPLKISYKQFYGISLTHASIFDCCNEILTNSQSKFNYEIDGLIFTHALFGVGSDKVGESGPKTNITWDYSFKWKPPKFNTIDFMVTNANEEDTNNVNVRPQEGLNNTGITNSIEYKKVVLRCGFNEYIDGYINPCQDIIDDTITTPTEDNQPVKSKMVPQRFYPTEPFDADAGITNIIIKQDSGGNKVMLTKEGTVFEENDIVEFYYENKEDFRWVPLRVRYDKTFPNKYATANSNWKSIHNPVTEEMITTGQNIPPQFVANDKYYNGNQDKNKYFTRQMKDFHNLVVKRALIQSVAERGNTLIDYACGKGGDMPKWINSKISFVFGIDKAKDNLENRLDGACARYLNAKKKQRNILDAIFVNGDSALNIRSGQGILSEQEKHVTNVVFGEGTEMVGPGIKKHYGIGEDGFNISSCQFALHYFFKDPNTLHGFLSNIAECTKINGYFIGTAYDGQKIFDMLLNKKQNEGITIMHEDNKIWEIIKEYEPTKFKNDSSSISYKIKVFQESINQYISEYLINFDYLEQLMEQYGFRRLTDEEAQRMRLPNNNSVGNFKDLFDTKIRKGKRNKDYGTSYDMNKEEKQISFLNNYFIYKKIRKVDVNNVNIDLQAYEDLNSGETSTPTLYIPNNKNSIQRPRIVKLKKQLLIVPAEGTTNTKKKRLIIKPNRVDET